MKKLKISELSRDGFHIIVRGIYESELQFDHLDTVTIGNTDTPLTVEETTSYGNGSHILLLSLPKDNNAEFNKIMNLSMFLAAPMYVNSVETLAKNGDPV